MKVIQLGKSVEVVVQPVIKETVSAVKINGIFDNPNAKRVVARLAGIPDVILWEGEGYDAAGDWTQEQAEARLIQILTA